MEGRRSSQSFEHKQQIVDDENPRIVTGAWFRRFCELRDDGHELELRQPQNKDPQFDRQEIRDALFARVHDSHNEARHEALVGLAHYKDPRVVAPLIEALHAESVWELAVEAAEAIGHPELHSHLTELRSWWDLNPQLLELAIVACGGSSENTESAPMSD